LANDSKAQDKLVKVKKSKSQKVKGDVANKVAEWGRVHLGAIARDKDMDRYIEVWTDIEKMCQTGVYSLKYVLGCVASASQLTDVQKIKMRDNVKALWEHVLS
jgi:transcription antitermination factor NusG